MEEMWSVVHNTGHRLTAGSRPIRNEDEHRIYNWQSCERAMLTGTFTFFTFTFTLPYLTVMLTL